MTANNKQTECFLCKPDPALVYETSESFYAMLGYGPIGEGYSLIATHDHVASMFDLEQAKVDELTAFASDVRARLSCYGPAAITEHGRVAACVAAATNHLEPHCLHAHRLVFPGLAHLDIPSNLRDLDFVGFASFAAAQRQFDWPGQYLYAENSDGGCRVAQAPQRLPRQFFRSLAADQHGTPLLADWHQRRSLDVVAAAQRKLGLVS
jgi:diadenosine tetraphosphate (Ap4A) HIT family hydrolase